MDKRAMIYNYDDNDDNSIESLHEEINKLRRERDEARRNVCLQEAAVLSFGPNGVPYHPSVAHKIAKEYGWDCFKPMCTDHSECAAQADNQGLSDIEKEP